MASMRKSKARLNKTKLAELKNKNTEAAEIVLNEENLKAIGDELVLSTIDGFQDELNKQSPTIQKMVGSMGGLIQEFFVGFKEGVDAEIKEFIKASNETIQSSTEGIAAATTKAVKDVTDAIEEKEERDRSRDRDLSKDYLNRKKDVPLPFQQSLARKSVGFGLNLVSGNSELFDRYAGKWFDSSTRREGFIQNETKIRSAADPEFAKKTIKEQRSILKSDYKTINKQTTKLQEIESQAKTLRDQGYSDEDIEKKLGFDEKRGSALDLLASADPSRFKADKPKSETPIKVPKPKSKSSDDFDIPKSEGLNPEELKQETELFRKKEFSEVERQSRILLEIRDAIKALNKSMPAEVGDATPGGSLLDKIPGASHIPGLVKSLGGGALRAGKSLLGAAKGFALPAALAYGASSAIDYGAGALGVTKDATGNEISIDEAQDNRNWEKASLTEKLGSGTARGIEKVGSFLGLDNIAKKARYERIKSETAYMGAKNGGLGTYPIVANAPTGNTIDLGTNPTPVDFSKPSTASIASDVAPSATMLAVKQLELRGSVPSNLSVDSRMVRGGYVPPNISRSVNEPSPEKVAETIGKNIVVNVPQPKVITNGGRSELLSAPFTSIIKNTEPSVNDYLRSRYS